MSVEDYLRVSELPELREPVLLAAFAGWNDAAQAATSALLALCLRDGVRRFGDIIPEDFFVFTDTRPTISLDPSRQRSIHWPANRFFACPLPEAERDAVLLIGTEPQLKWQTFCDIVLSLSNRLEVSTLVTLGGLLADVPHTLAPRLSGFASDAEHVKDLQALDVGLSAYEGPTGIVGALHNAWSATHRPAYSLWGSVPHYISASPNPPVSLALLRAVEGLLHVPLQLGELESQAQRFTVQINEAVARNPEAVAYVEQLESQYDVTDQPENTPDLLHDLEQFLRSNRPEDD